MQGSNFANFSTVGFGNFANKFLKKEILSPGDVQVVIKSI